MKIKTSSRKLSAFSILELTVTLGIVGIIMVMLSNILITSISISQKSLARSFAREEVSQIVDAIASDIKGANEIKECSGDIAAGVNCRFISDAEYLWTTCPGTNPGDMRICKFDSAGNQIYASSPSLNFYVFNIERGFESGDSEARRNILITLAASDIRTGLGINNIVRQTSVSTRNYLLSFASGAGAGGSSPAFCGNGIVEAGETCDDGNLVDGDGCNRTCSGNTCLTTRETIVLTLPDIPGSRNCQVRGSGSGDSLVRAYSVTSAATSSNSSICSLRDANFATLGRTRYDDNFYLTMNDIVILSSNIGLYNHLPEVSPGIKRLSNPNALLNTARWSGNIPVCIGGVIGSNSNPAASCYAPRPETNVASFGTDIDLDFSYELSNLISGDRVEVKAITVGNRNSGDDCSLRGGIRIELEVDSVPAGCDCPATPPPPDKVQCNDLDKAYFFATKNTDRPNRSITTLRSAFWGYGISYQPDNNANIWSRNRGASTPFPTNLDDYGHLIVSAGESVGGYRDITVQQAQEITDFFNDGKKVTFFTNSAMPANSNLGILLRDFGFLCTPNPGTGRSTYTPADSKLGYFVSQEGRAQNRDGCSLTVLPNSTIANETPECAYFSPTTGQCYVGLIKRETSNQAQGSVLVYPTPEARGDGAPLIGAFARYCSEEHPLI